MSDILSEAQADKEVIKNLLKYIRKLERRNPMSKILFDKNGDLYRVTAYEKLNQEDIDREIAESKAQTEDLQGAIEFSNKLQTPETTQNETPAPAPEAPAPAPVQIPVNDTTVATPEGVQTQPETPAAPAVEEPKAEEQAQADPATAPAPVGPAPIVLS